MTVKFVPTPKNLELISKSLALMTSYLALHDLVEAASEAYEEPEMLTEAFTTPIYDSVDAFCEVVEGLQSKESPSEKDIAMADEMYLSASLIVMTYIERVKEGIAFEHLESKLTKKRKKVKLTLVK